MISAYTETSEVRDAEPKNWVLFDGDCSFCTGLAKRYGPWLLKHGYRMAPLQAAWVRERLGLTEGALFTEMRLLTSDGKLYGGADALIAIARTIWWAKPLALLARLPGVHAPLQATYRRLAARRHCLSSACGVGTGTARPRRSVKWLGFLTLPPAALVLTHNQPAWIMMWSVALAIGVGCKWLTFLHADSSRVGFGRSFGYLFAWPGMDPRPFLDKNTLKGGQLTVTSGIFCTIIGAVLLWGLARHLRAELFTGWVGMAGLVLLLHFGIFRLLACAWQNSGVAVSPIMNAPLAAKSVSEFWGRRWNIAFHQLAHEFVFRPLRARLGASPALVTGFLASGLVHDLVISVPARAGYGLPTAYFLLQALAVLVERSGFGWRSRVFLISATFLPAFFLFHPAFIHRVFLPFMRAIGAL